MCEAGPSRKRASEKPYNAGAEFRRLLLSAGFARSEASHPECIQKYRFVIWPKVIFYAAKREVVLRCFTQCFYGPGFEKSWGNAVYLSLFISRSSSLLIRPLLLRAKRSLEKLSRSSKNRPPLGLRGSTRGKQIL